jgi:uncharacterized SAM-binding protein YcdF (DUF218 family)
MSLLAHLAEPATFVAALLLMALLWSWRTTPARRRRKAARPWVAMLLVYLAFATPLGGNALLLPLENRARQAAAACQAEGPAPALAIVLAGGVDTGASTAGDYQFLSEASLRRSIVAAQWARAEPARRLLLSGGYGDVAEAVLMARLLEELGIAPQRITIDSRSINTAQSGHNIARQLRERQIERVGIITSADHMPRAQAELQAHGISTCALPMDYRYVAPLMPGHLVPQLTALGKSTRALHEYLGMLAARWRHTEN